MAAAPRKGEQEEEAPVLCKQRHAATETSTAVAIATI